MDKIKLNPPDTIPTDCRDFLVFYKNIGPFRAYIAWDYYKNYFDIIEKTSDGRYVSRKFKGRDVLGWIEIERFEA
jgi:hypothetical protein